MLIDVLAYIADHQGAPVTEIKKRFGLSSDLAANLLIQLEDAGFLHEQKLDACHHMDEHGHFTDAHAGHSGCSGCGSSCAVSVGFERGCCGMNSPYRVTERGIEFLGRMRSLAG
ncbi:MAG TPA: hypothetical protein V6D05_18000 [Stenomitos sp.]